MTPCEHIETGMRAEPEGDVCRPCADRGDTWVHLRACTTCGAVRCCDSSPNRHATKHVWESGHPVVRSYQPGETWWWCYPDQLWVPSVSGFRALRS